MSRASARSRVRARANQRNTRRRTCCCIAARSSGVSAAASGKRTCPSSPPATAPSIMQQWKCTCAFNVLPERWTKLRAPQPPARAARALTQPRLDELIFVSGKHARLEAPEHGVGCRAESRARTSSSCVFGCVLIQYPGRAPAMRMIDGGTARMRQRSVTEDNPCGRARKAQPNVPVFHALSRRFPSCPDFGNLGLAGSITRVAFVYTSNPTMQLPSIPAPRPSEGLVERRGWMFGCISRLARRVVKVEIVK